MPLGPYRIGIAQITETVSLVDKASVASDRWLFLAALAIIIIGGAAIIRWLVASLEAKDKAHVASLEAKDKAHDEATRVVQEEHKKERVEWRAEQATVKAEFLSELKQQRTDFRAELALERVSAAKMADTVEKLVAHAVPGVTSSLGTK